MTTQPRKPSPRTVHRAIGRILYPFLLLTAVTGLTFRLGRNWFGMSKETGAIVRSIHEGSIVGKAFAPIYVLVVGLALLVMIGAGVSMWRRAARSTPTAPRSRRWHRLASFVLAAPLALSAITGIAFRVGRSWLGWSEDGTKLLMSLHQGSWLGPKWRALYVLFVGLGLLYLLGSAAPMLWRLRGASATKRAASRSART
ncbi:MAG: PepSY domain-containing protein [Labilithrix sp.]|nr:PepSY domain-containing protein [Labilithrix sp.]